MTWRVMRQDDNGQTYEVASGLDEAAARRMVEELEARGHKQLYTAEPLVGYVVVATLAVRAAELAAFAEFERAAAAIMRRHGGAIERALRFVEPAGGELVRELHVVRFADREAFARYRADPELAALRPLRERAVVATEIAEAVDAGPY